MLKIFEDILKKVKKYVRVTTLTRQDLDDLVSEVIISLLAAYRKYKNLNKALEENIIKKAVLRFLSRLKSESLLKEKLRKEVMKFLGFGSEDNLMEDNKEKENGS